MKYTEDPCRATELIKSIGDELEKEYQGKRDSRPRVHDLLYCLRRSWRERQVRLHPGEHDNWIAPEEDENQKLILIIGMALHDIVAKASGRKPNDALFCDWMAGELDARILTSGVIEEFKTARAGMKEDDPIHFPHYMEQVASYEVLALENGSGETVKLLLEGLPQAVLHVLHVTFNSMPKLYEPHPRQLKKETDEQYEQRLYELRAQARINWEQKVAEWVEEQGKHSNLRSWPLTFTPDEIERWRDELLRRYEIWMGDEEPGTDECAPMRVGSWTQQSWECEHCPMHVRKGGDCPGGPGRPASFFVIDREDREED